MLHRRRPIREVTDENGRVYRVGESDVDIMGRKRKWMVILPWVGMMGISSAEYAFASAEDTLQTAHGWNDGHIFWMLGVWVFFQGGVAFPAGKLREIRETARALGDDAGRGRHPARVSLARVRAACHRRVRRVRHVQRYGRRHGLRDLREHGRQVVSGTQGWQDRLRQRRFRLRLGAVRVHLHRLHGHQ